MLNDIELSFKDVLKRSLEHKPLADKQELDRYELYTYIYVYLRPSDAGVICRVTDVVEDVKVYHVREGLISFSYQSFISFQQLEVYYYSNRLLKVGKTSC